MSISPSQKQFRVPFDIQAIRFYVLLSSDLLKNLHQHGYQACINDFLDLAALASSDVRNCPRCFFLDVGVGVSQQDGEHCQRTCIQHTLGLLISSSHDVADGSQSWGLRKGKRAASSLLQHHRQHHNVRTDYDFMLYSCIRLEITKTKFVYSTAAFLNIKLHTTMETSSQERSWTRRGTQSVSTTISILSFVPSVR